MLQHPLPVQPHTVRLGVDTETLLGEQLLHLTYPDSLLHRPEREGDVCVCVCVRGGAGHLTGWLERDGLSLVGSSRGWLCLDSVSECPESVSEPPRHAPLPLAGSDGHVIVT